MSESTLYLQSVPSIAAYRPTRESGLKLIIATDDHHNDPLAEYRTIYIHDDSSVLAVMQFNVGEQRVQVHRVSALYILDFDLVSFRPSNYDFAWECSQVWIQKKLDVEQERSLVCMVMTSAYSFLSEGNVEISIRPQPALFPRSSTVELSVVSRHSMRKFQRYWKVLPYQIVSKQKFKGKSLYKLLFRGSSLK